MVTECSDSCIHLRLALREERVELLCGGRITLHHGQRRQHLDVIERVDAFDVGICLRIGERADRFGGEGERLAHACLKVFGDGFDDR